MRQQLRPERTPWPLPFPNWPATHQRRSAHPKVLPPGCCLGPPAPPYPPTVSDLALPYLNASAMRGPKASPPVPGSLRSLRATQVWCLDNDPSPRSGPSTRSAFSPDTRIASICCALAVPARGPSRRRKTPRFRTGQAAVYRLFSLNKEVAVTGSRRWQYDDTSHHEHSCRSTRDPQHRL